MTKQHGRQYTNLNEFTSPAYLMTFMTSVVQISALKTKPYKYMFVDETKSRYYITSHTEITSVLNRLHGA